MQTYTDTGKTHPRSAHEHTGPMGGPQDGSGTYIQQAQPVKPAHHCLRQASEVGLVDI